ncbi:MULTISPECIES: hypothetical protein [Sphingomonas]|jgi:hypothetical protein|uniref:hypothetical protein n=1 Tax=Sphingomonas TaxID=13687 RepID=UPI001AE4D9A3
MESAIRYVARRRPEPDLVDRWGLFALATGCWLDVHFATEAEAASAIAILQNTTPSPDRPRRPSY